MIIELIQVDVKEAERIQRSLAFMQAAGVFNHRNGATTLHWNSQGELIKIDSQTAYLRDKPVVV